MVIVPQRFDRDAGQGGELTDLQHNSVIKSPSGGGSSAAWTFPGNVGANGEAGGVVRPIRHGSVSYDFGPAYFEKGGPGAEAQNAQW